MEMKSKLATESRKLSTKVSASVRTYLLYPNSGTLSTDQNTLKRDAVRLSKILV